MENIGTMILPLALLAFFYFIMIRPEKKKQKQARDMMNSLRTGDEIMTRGGIYGRITYVDDDSIVVATGPDEVQVKLSRFSVATVTKKAEDIAVQEDPVETAADEINEDINE